MRSSGAAAAAAVLSLLLHAFAVAHAGSYLKLGVDECFERVSIGKRLNNSDVTKTIPAHNVKQCNNECERILCNAYSFGLSGNGNGTCLLGSDLPKSGPYDDPEYDLFMKILQCRDRTSCFNKLVGGRRLADKFIQRTMPAESKGECEIFCEYEKEFRCAGFNFRYDMKSDSYSSCQLTSIPPEKLDLSTDFHSDVDYDFYEKNVNASPICRYLEFTDPYGQRRQWDISGNEPDLSLWQDLNPSLFQKNDVGYGNDKVYYDLSIHSTPAAGSGYNRGEVPMTFIPDNDNPYNNVQFGYNGINPILSVENRMPATSNECFIKARTGHHLQRDNIIKSVNAPSLYGCENICANEQTFMCNMFSYRYSFTSLMDNCHLSDKMLRQLDIFQDLVPDRDCDVFVRNELSQPGCQPARNWDTDCFERIRSGLTFEVAIVKFSVQTENLHECELICLHVKHFTCRVFSFRRGAAVIGKWSDNCYLTDYPILEMDPNKHFVQDTECDIFNRGSYGRGCELDKTHFPTGPWPTGPGQDLTPTVHTTYRPQYGVPPPLSPTPSGYGPKYGPPPSPPLQFFPVIPSGSPIPPPSPSPSPPSSQYFPVRPITPTPSPPTQYFPVTPTTFVTSTRRTGTYVPSLPPTTFYPIQGEYTPAGVKPSNRNPDPGVFKDSFNPYGQNPTRGPILYGPYGPPKKLCYINFGSTARLLPSAIKKSMNVESEDQCKMECNKARDSQYFRCSSLSYFAGYCELSDIEMRDLKPNQDFSMDQQFLLFTWDFNQVHCFGLTPVAKVPPTNNVPVTGLEWTWLRFTVNGQPCRSGSYCTKNADMGIWSCPVEQGGWDYCCKPEHKCGYSEGISYPWCYVGHSSEQWRPCSDKYYPSADGMPQTWPVTYIHHSGPPTTSVTVFPGLSSPSPLPPRRIDEAVGNGTITAIKHEQSLVDQFLAIFRTSSETPPPSPEPASSRAPETNNKTASLIASHHVDLPGFRVVDVTDIPQTVNRAAVGSVNRLYSYEASNRFRNTFKYRKPYV
ncbi:PAN/Apple domain [Cinara cedri]|uniref:PAN/Apple domain n=1 Tax=Cinara cedri TaxID=506608 RepID=A0A5E4NQP0_9HEMI|nr:PAN/Apple domain [Cinara cedri]